VIVTETGWDRRHVADQTNAVYLDEELRFYRDRGIELVAVYAHTGPQWGVLDEGTRVGRPQAGAIRRFMTVF